MFKVFPNTSNSYSLSISLYQASASPSHLILYLSGQILNPKSIILTYKPVSNLSKSNTFNLGNCNYTANSSSPLSYTFLPTSSCNFDVFQGSYFITQATYNNAGINTSFVMKNELPIGYELNGQTTYATLSVNPANVPIDANIKATINTNMSNSIYSLSLGTYIINQCIGISTSTSCQFNVNSSIGAYPTNSFYILNAYIYNTTENEKINTSIYVS